ncbi:hypothetical protein Tco_1039250 [Tanacetum coccineum]
MLMVPYRVQQQQSNKQLPHATQPSQNSKVDHLYNLRGGFSTCPRYYYISRGLREDYNGLKSTLLARQAPTTFYELQGLLTDHDYMIKQFVPVIPSQTGSKLFMNV